MKIKAFLFLLFISSGLMAEWVPFSPEGIKSNCIAFYVDNLNHWAVGADEIHLYNLNQQTWNSYFSLLPVKDISYMDGDNILFIMSAGPWCMEDGIHYLYMETGTVYALKYAPVPHFIEYSQQESLYYVGYMNGLLFSSDFTNWSDHSAFMNMEIVDMDIWEDHYVISRLDSIYSIYRSPNAGSSWEISSGAPMISDLEFDNNGKLYGVFPDNSWSSGLWSSNDFGETWNVEFWATGIKCVGTDFMGNVFVGFGEDALPPYEGIARWDSANQQLHFMNEGLPNLNINQITYNPGMSAPAIFCCTDTGVYINYTYIDIEEVTAPSAPPQLWPNPALDQLHIRHGLDGNVQISIYSGAGKLVETFSNSGMPEELNYNCSHLIQGIYFIMLDNGRERKNIKWIKL
ncbi:MAG: T9SS type A sorting domain-containing protein [Bacteroidota bacterium]